MTNPDRYEKYRKRGRVRGPHSGNVEGAMRDTGGGQSRLEAKTDHIKK